MLVIAAVLCASLATTASAEYVAEGNSGSAVTWVLDSDGTLSFYGNGPMLDYPDFGQSSWYSMRDDIKKVVIHKGVTTVGDFAFSCCMSITDAVIADSVTSIGANAFWGCANLESVTIKNPECVIDDHNNSFYSGATIYGYEGSTAQAYAEKYSREFEIIYKETDPICVTESGTITLLIFLQFRYITIFIFI